VGGQKDANLKIRHYTDYDDEMRELDQQSRKDLGADESEDSPLQKME